MRGRERPRLVGPPLIRRYAAGGNPACGVAPRWGEGSRMARLVRLDPPSDAAEAENETALPFALHVPDCRG